ncbi:MAG TPA: DUF4143 domain-containing protein, partial [Acidimicrobiales bacterium]|nr:DUF4143 domain-containing protein [Acidimicrobiales bacterium]
MTPPGDQGRHTADTLRSSPTTMGPLLHVLVVNELAAQGAWHEGADICHWRNRNDEVDVVVRYPDGLQVPIEVKAARTVNRHDAEGIRLFRRRTGRSGVGIVLYLGNRSYALEPGIWALPVQALWEPGFTTDATGEIPASPAPSPPSPSPADPALAGRPDQQAPPGAADGGVAVRASDAVLFLSYVHEDDRTM